MASIPTYCNSESQTMHGEMKTVSVGADFSSTEDKLKISSDEECKSTCGISLSFLNFLVDLIGPTLTDGRRLKKLDKMVLFFMKLKLNLSFVCLSVMFSIDRRTVSEIFSSVLDAMFEATRLYVWWIPKERIKATMPKSFQEVFPDCRVIIDASEVRCESPVSVQSQVLMYSNYKNGFTMKYLIGVAPSGLITFLSKAYGGRVTDCQLTADSGLLRLLEPGDVVLADKGFPTIVESVEEKGAFVCMPPFKRGDRQFSNQENVAGYNCSSVRIHVERAIARMKYFKILKFLDHSLLSKVDKILVCIAFVCNNFNDLIQNNE